MLKIQIFFFSLRFCLRFILKLVLPWRGLRLDQSHDFQDLNAVKRSFHRDIWEIHTLIKEIRQVQRGCSLYIELVRTSVNAAPVLLAAQDKRRMDLGN